jgi:hypothetical protein
MAPELSEHLNVVLRLLRTEVHDIATTIVGRPVTGLSDLPERIATDPEGQQALYDAVASAEELFGEQVRSHDKQWWDNEVQWWSDGVDVHHPAVQAMNAIDILRMLVSVIQYSLPDGEGIGANIAAVNRHLAATCRSLVHCGSTSDLVLLVAQGMDAPRALALVGDSR